MPPRRRPPAPSASSSSKPAVARPSKLAKENNITAQEEAEIREAFGLFAEPLDDDVAEKDQELVIPITDVRRALIALGLPPSSPSQLAEFTAALDPDDQGFATYPSFLGICALQLHAQRDNMTDEAHQAELDEAFALFAGGRPDAEVITLGMLKRVVELLRLDQADDDGGNGLGGNGKKKKGGDDVVTEELLRDMILEANGGAGVGRGVRKEEFDGVMRRAGVWR